MTTPSFAYEGAGDSNEGCGDQFDSTLDSTDPNIVELLSTGAFNNPATEPLENNGSMNAHAIGSSLSTAKKWVQDGNLIGRTPGWNVTMLGVGAAGNDFAHGFAVDSAYAGGVSSVPGRKWLDIMYTRMLAHIALDPRNMVTVFDWNHGLNETGNGSPPDSSYDGYIAHLNKMVREIKATIPAAARMIVLVAGCPPDFFVPGLGDIATPGLIGAQKDCALFVPDSVYVDVTELHSTFHNLYIHFTGDAHRGGPSNALARLFNTLTPFVTGEYCLGSDSHVYKRTSVSSGTPGFNPVGDGGVHWTDTGVAEAFPIYNSGTTYPAAGRGDAVVDPTNGVIYASQHAGNVGNQPASDNGTNWKTTGLALGRVEFNSLTDRKWAAMKTVGCRVKMFTGAGQAPPAITDLVASQWADNGTGSPNFTPIPSTSKLLLTFTPPIDARGIDAQYSVHGLGSFTLVQNIGPCWLSGLTGATSYDVQVRAKNQYGNGPWSNLSTASTA